MTKKSLEQQSPIPAPPSHSILLGAFLTSYRPVSPHFLLRDVLPALLQLDRSESLDAATDHLFIGSTVAALEKVPGKISIVTSCAPPEESTSRLPWLNSYIQTYMVGSDADCIQHAKLWLCHWWTPDGEQLQITVSSTNLTSDAFHGQLQAGWSICLPLASAALRSKPHAALCDFLDNLGNSAGCREVSRRFIDLLERCPEVPGSHFIASIPNKQLDKKQAKLLAGMHAAASAGVHILTPSIGNWDNLKDIEAWCRMVGVATNKVKLFWPQSSHPWVGAATTLDPGTWKMPASVHETLKDANVRLLAVPDPSEESVLMNGEADDQRWCHAKLYGFRHGLMLGSHNWSKAAWGLPHGPAPQNFELSVFVENQALPMRGPFKPFTGNIGLMERQPQDDAGYWLRWAHATLTADNLQCDYRLHVGFTALAEWHDGQDWQPFPPCVSIGAKLKVSQTLDGAQPTQVRLTCCEGDQEQLVLPIVDLRPGMPPPIAVSEQTRHLVEDIELESYGGPPAEPGQSRVRKRKKDKRPASDADYSMEWLISARRWRRVVDAWLVSEESHPADVRNMVGLRLAAALERKAGDDPGAAIASEELRLMVSEAESC